MGTDGELEPATEIRFEVRGLPIVEGNLRAGRNKAGGVYLFHRGSKSLNAWRNAVATEARAHAPPAPWEGPIGVGLMFHLPQPKSVPTHRGRGKKRHPVKSWPDRRPDLDKYVRAALDALSNVVFGDDGQVVALGATKEYGVPGLKVWVWRVEEFHRAPIPTPKSSGTS